MKLNLEPMPLGGVKCTTKPGHYIDNRGNAAQIVTVGAYQGRAAYEKSLPGFEVEQVEILWTENKQLDGTFISVILKRG